MKAELYDRWLKKEQIPKDEGYKFREHYEETYSFQAFKLQEALRELVVSVLPKN